ncbi:MAG TPA: hypothetical protein VNQ76_15680 [Planctomicrobium sp.]|nr:hypothetical protein [Planctomicrobium sp.]
MKLFIAIILCLMMISSGQCVQAQHRSRLPSIAASPSDEITVFDPTSNSEPKPTPAVAMGNDGKQYVEIPPTVIVHNFYYTGDRDFRGPRFSGGPSIVVVNHPLTEERLYLEVQMLPGAPRVSYRKGYIDYDFGSDRIRLRFLHPLHPHADPTVEYLHGKNFKDTIGSTGKAHSGAVSRWVHRTGVPDAAHHVAAGAVGTLQTTADGVKFVGTVTTTPIVKIVRATPLGSIVTPSPERTAIRGRDMAIERSQHRERNDNATISTLR